MRVTTGDGCWSCVCECEVAHGGAGDAGNIDGKLMGDGGRFYGEGYHRQEVYKDIYRGQRRPT
jgi:hypothetical protein